VRPLASGVLRAATPVVAESLLGTLLVHDSPAGRTVGRIVETEAYLADGDGASHSARGPTPRCASMFLEPGHAYVYLIYGVHLCFNVVTGPVGSGEAVLIRALEPLEGLDLMQQRRGAVALRDLTNGPGKCAQAMGLERGHDGLDLGGGSLRLAARAPGWSPGRVVTTGRVGISKSVDLALRFYLEGSTWVSRRDAVRESGSARCCTRASHWDRSSGGSRRGRIRGCPG
jgi:DNA-3-methyladenine glycosylase